MVYKPKFSPVPFRLGIYPIVKDVIWIKRLLDIGVRTIQLRIKDKSKSEIENEIARAVELSCYYNARLFINDYWSLAIKYQAWGTHLGQEDLKNANLEAIQESGIRLGISTHNDIEIDAALELKPSYIALGHIFPTQTKKMPSFPQGLRKLTQHVKRLSDYPTVAVGGISAERIPYVLETGVGSVAVVSAITQVKDWKSATIYLLKLVGAGDIGK